MKQNKNKRKKIPFIKIALIILTIILIVKAVQVIQENRSKAASTSISVENPYTTSQTKSYKGNIHCHSNISDGSRNPQKVYEYYKKLGYDFISLTDHLFKNNANEIKNWEDKTTVNTDSGSILNLPGVERFVDNESKKGHINLLSSKKLTDELNFSKNNLSDYFDDSKSNGIYIINHPKDPDHGADYWTDSRLKTIKNYNGVEVWNGVTAEDVWDKLLSFDKKIWGFAGDDCHYNSDKNDKCGTAFIRVFSDNLNRDDIFSNIKKGNFYSQHIKKGGTDINLKISVENNIITVNTDIGSTIKFISINTKTKKQDKNATTLSYNIVGNEKYIRVKIIRSKSTAWSNPIFIKTTTLSGGSGGTNPAIISPVVTTPPTITVKPTTPPIVTRKITETLGKCGEKVSKSDDGCTDCGGKCVATLKTSGECNLSSDQKGTIKVNLCLSSDHFIGYRCCLPKNIPGIVLPGDKKCQDKGGICIKTDKTSGECNLSSDQKGTIKVNLCLSNIHKNGYRCCVPKK